MVGKDERRQRWASLTPKSLIEVRDKLCVPHGYLYVFAARSFVKVGMSKFDVYRRWHSMKTDNPWLEPPLYVSPPLLDRVRPLEKACHVALAEYHRSGEWFECERGFAIETVQRVVQESP